MQRFEQQRHDSIRQLYPTESALRQKKKRAEGHVVQPRKKHVEQHQDDCGENFDILKVTTSDASEASVKEQAFYDLACLVIGSSTLQFYGSGTEVPPTAWTTCCNSFNMASIFYQRARYDEPGIDCMELFGGSGTTTFLLAKYHGLKTGVNFELSCGIDLSKDADIRYLFAYIRRNKPKVILLAPPCKGYSKWGHLNKKINYEAWLNSRKLSVPLARLSGDVAVEQVSSGRHAFVEQPHGSGLFEEPEMVETPTTSFHCSFRSMYDRIANAEVSMVACSKDD